jgi:hypothetical protein
MGSETETGYKVRRRTQRKKKKMSRDSFLQSWLPWLMRLIKNSLTAAVLHCTHCARKSSWEGKDPVRARQTQRRRDGRIFFSLMVFAIGSLVASYFPTPGTAAAVSPLSQGILSFVFPVWLCNVFFVLFQCVTKPLSWMYFTHQLTISRLNWHIRNLRARQLRTHLLGRICSSDWPLFSRNSNPLPATIVPQKLSLRSPSLRHKGFYRTPQKRLQSPTVLLLCISDPEDP